MTQNLLTKSNNNSIFLLDLGSGYTKLGLYTDEQPYKIIPSEYGIPSIGEHKDENDEIILYEKELENYRSALTRKNLFPHSQPNDINEVFKFLEVIFKNSPVPTENAGLVLATSTEWSDLFVDKLKNYMFDIFKFGSILPIQSDLLALLSHKLKTGVVINIGHYCTRITQFNNGKAISKSGYKSNVAGRMVRKYLLKLYSENFPYLKSPMFSSFISDIVRKNCHLEIDINAALSKEYSDSLKIQNIEITQFKDVLKLGSECFLIPEVLFHPKLMNIQDSSVDELIIQSLKECHTSLRQKIYSNIVFSGGGCSYSNFLERIKKSFLNIPLLNESKIYLHEDPRLSVWKGMQIIVKSSFYEKNAEKNL